MAEFETIDDDELREAIALPRNIPRARREEIASILYREIVLGEDYEVRDVDHFVDRLGVFYLILISLKGLDEWARLKQLASSGGVSALILLRIVLTEVFDLLDDFAGYEPAIDELLTAGMTPYLKQFSAILEKTLELWHRRTGDKTAQRPTGVSAVPDIGDLQLNVNRFEEDGERRQFLNILSRDVLMRRIMGQVGDVEDHLDSLEILSLLYPGRGWDQSMLELHRTYYAGLHRYSRIVEQSEDLKKILDIIGRSETEQGTGRLSMAAFSHSELYSVTTSGDLQHMLPVESVKLQDDTLRNLFFAQWIEKKLLTYQLMGMNWATGPKKKRGPMVVMVDTSGSMHGDPEIVAKSIVLALVRRTLKEGRDIKVYLFSSVGQTTDIELTNTNRMAREFLDFLSQTFEGGTDFNTALRESIEALKKKRYANADILFITDGLSVVSDERAISGLETMKRENGTRLFTIVVGNDSAGGIDRFSDRVFILDGAGHGDPRAGPADVIRLISAR